MIDAPRHTARQIADDVVAGMDPDVEGVPAQYYDAAIQRIAELEEKLSAYKKYEVGINAFGTLEYLYISDREGAKREDENKSLKSELARVKAESLRVVADGGPVTAFRLDGNDKFIQVEGEVYYRSGEALICTNTRIYQGLDDDTIVQPVALERWEEQG